MVVAENRAVSGGIASATAKLAAAGLALGLVTVAGCGDDGSGLPCAGVDCSGHGTCFTDGLRPLCACDPGYRPAGAECVSDGDGGDSGGDGTDDAGEVTDHGGSCDPGGTDDRCAGGILARCRTDGTGFVEIPCPFGCAPDGTRCGELDVPNVTDDEVINSGTADVAIPAAAGAYVLVDSDTGAITVHDGAGGMLISFRLPVVGLDPVSGVYYVTQVQGADLPDLGVFAMRSLTVPAGVTVVGVGSRGLVLTASGAIRVEGSLSVAARGAPWLDRPGAGGGSGGRASPPARGTGLGGGRAGREDGGMGALVDSGGGGGGFGGTGGAGGEVGTLVGGPGGIAYGESVIEPMRGGSGGGAGGDTANHSGAGGHGGGAIEIVSATSIDVAGSIVASGGGGRGGTGTGLWAAGSGGGGGSGGAILLEAPVVRVSGVLAANGGAGGGGAAGTTAGTDGDGGAASATPARGGAGGLAGGNDGAAGSAGSTPDGAVAARCDFTASCTDTGGGGGGAGRIRINANSTDLAGTLSPAADTGLATTGHVRTR